MRGFEDKFLSKIGKIDRRRIRDYLAQALSEKHFLETIFDHLNEGILVTDGAMGILYSNRMARHMLQWPLKSQWLGEKLVDHCPPGELKDLVGAMQQRPHPIKGYDCSFGSEGDRRLSLTAIAIDPPQKTKTSPPETPDSTWVFILQDITERSRMLEEQSLAQRMASLALLTSGVAHEIKNPLNSLNIHAEILLKEADDQTDGDQVLDRDRVRRAAEVILEETARLTDIVNGFIEAARPQPPQLERKALNRIIEDLIRVFAQECEQEGIELKSELDPDLPPMDLDAHLMFQALRNLIRNAIEAHRLWEGDEDGATRRNKDDKAPMIIVRTKLGDDYVAVEIADNGPGIEEENIDKIFEPYYTTKFNGTGLGLMVVYRVIIQHQGSIHVDSKPGVGTRFVISLPLAERPLRLLDRPAPMEGRSPDSKD